MELLNLLMFFPLNSQGDREFCDSYLVMSRISRYIIHKNLTRYFTCIYILPQFRKLFSPCSYCFSIYHFHFKSWFSRVFELYHFFIIINSYLLCIELQVVSLSFRAVLLCLLPCTHANIGKIELLIEVWHIYKNSLSISCFWLQRYTQKFVVTSFFSFGRYVWRHNVAIMLFWRGLPFLYSLQSIATKENREKTKDNNQRILY